MTWVYIWKLRDGKVYSYDQFNDPGLAQAFAYSATRTRPMP
jgi:ketosteroid isomerase-like protein